MADRSQRAGGRAVRVTRTGIALVHRGELILPASGSEAEGEQVADDAQANIVYRFPIHIEIRNAGQPVDTEAIINEALNRLAQSADSATIGLLLLRLGGGSSGFVG